jgi:hypothetical protein
MLDLGVIAKRISLRIADHIEETRSIRLEPEVYEGWIVAGFQPVEKLIGISKTIASSQRVHPEYASVYTYYLDELKRILEGVDGNYKEKP